MDHAGLKWRSVVLCFSFSSQRVSTVSPDKTGVGGEQAELP
jgi:hypothetical protein